jgi:hypothetical protein
LESNINFGKFWSPTLTLGVFWSPTLQLWKIGVQRFNFGNFWNPTECFFNYLHRLKIIKFFVTTQPLALKSISRLKAKAG